MNEPVSLDVTAASEIAAFTRVASAFDLLSTSSVESSIFDDPDPTLHLAIYDGGLEAVGSAVVRGRRGYVKFLAVHPRVRLRGNGTILLEAIEGFCREAGAKTLEVGCSAPFYVVPGVDVRSTETICFFQQRGFERVGDAVNQGVRLSGLDEPPLPCHTAGPAEVEAMLPWIREHYEHWIPELMRGAAKGTCVAFEDIGFACYDVNRDGWFGPMATKPGAGRPGVGTSTLLTALHRMKARGHSHAEIAWSGPLLFYMKAVNARISRVFWWFRKEL